MSHDDELLALFRQAVRVRAATTSKHKATYDPATLDHALAEERISRSVRQPRPQHAPATWRSLRPEPKPKRFSAKEAFSVAAEKKRQKKQREALYGPRARPGSGQRRRDENQAKDIVKTAWRRCGLPE